MTPVTQRFGSALFWVLLGALAIANLLVMWQSLTVFRFWEDEAFNLTVPLNLLAGLGYTSDGALSGSTLTPFDPRISTGASVLLPVAAVLSLGVDPVIGARLIPLAYWMLLLAGLGVLGRRIAGRWGALVAVALPLAFQTAGSNSPIQGPADLLGEIPAAALIVWALVVLPRRAWLAGLLFGLAIQAKLIAFIALPAFAVALWALTPGRGWPRVWATLRRSVVPLSLAALPTLLMEVAAFVTLTTTGGLSAYVGHLRALRDFLLGGGQNVETTSIAQKLTTLLDAWFVPLWALALVAVVGVVVVVYATRVSRARAVHASGPALGSAAQSPEASPARAGAAPARAAVAPRGDGQLMSANPQLLALGLSALIGLATFVGWWAQASHTPLWVRHPAPGVFAFAPILVAFVVRGVQVLWRSPGATRVLASVTAVVLAATLAVAASLHVTAAFASGNETLAHQRIGVAAIAQWAEDNDQHWLAAQPWGAAVPAVVLSGTHLGLFDAPAMANTPRLTGMPCEGETLVDTGPYRLCAAE